MSSGHPTLAELEREPPSPEVAAHLAACVACRVDRRLLHARPPVPGPPTAPPAATSPSPAPPPTSPPDDLPATPHYELRRLIGVGSSAEVHEAWDPVLRRTVALKILGRHGPRARARFLAEARVTAQLDHPNVVPVHHLGITEDGRPYVAEREVRGVSLAEAVHAGRLGTLVARVDALRKVCAAVAFAHSRGVVHRDLKPDNVMVGELAEVQVVDWGLSGRSGPPLADAAALPALSPDAVPPVPASPWLTRDGEVIGTPAWMAPEQARGEHVDARADVYALGAVLFFLAVGRPPVLATDPEEALAAVAAGKVPAPRDVAPRVPREIDAIVRRAMAADPTDRYPDARALLEDLDAWIERRPLPHVGSSFGERVGKFVVRHRLPLAAVGATVALALLGAAGGAWRYAEDMGLARDAAEAEAARAREAERRALVGEIAAEVALADAARLDDCALDAAAALDRADSALALAGGDRRNAEWARAALTAGSALHLSACTPVPGHALVAVALSPDGTGAVGLADDGTVATWDPADCSPGARASVTASTPTTPTTGTTSPPPPTVITGAVAWLVDGPAAVALVDGEIVHMRPGGGPGLRERLTGTDAADADATDSPTFAAATRFPPTLTLHPWGEGALVAPDGRWWTFRFGAPALHAERPWPGPTRLLRLVPGGKLAFAEVTGPDGAVPGLWDRATLAPRGDRWMAEDVAADGRAALVTAPDGIRAVDLATGATRWAHAETPFGATGVVPGDRLAWRSLVGVVRVYDLADGRVVGEVNAPHSQVHVAASRDARVLVTWGDGPAASAWLHADGPGPHLAPETPAPQAPDLAASPDGHLLAIAGARGFAGVELLDLATRRFLRSLPTGAPVDTLAFSPDGTLLAATVTGEGVRVWDVATGREAWRWAGRAEPAPVDWVGDAVVTVDQAGDLVILVGGVERQRIPTVRGPSWDVATVPGTRLVVVGARSAPAAAVVDTEAGEVIRRLDTGQARTQVSVSRDGSVAALAGFDGRTILWDLATGATRSLDAGAGIIGVDLSPDGSVAVTAGFEEELAFWDLASGDRLRVASLRGMGSRVLYTPTGRLFVVSRNWKVEEVPLDDHQRAHDAVAGLAGGPLDRARAFAALGWWDRVIPELDRGPDDPLLRAQAWLAQGRPDRAAEAARGAPESVYRHVLENLPPAL